MLSTSTFTLHMGRRSHGSGLGRGVNVNFTSNDLSSVALGIVLLWKIEWTFTNPSSNRAPRHCLYMTLP